MDEANKIIIPMNKFLDTLNPYVEDRYSYSNMLTVLNKFLVMNNGLSSFIDTEVPEIQESSGDSSLNNIYVDFGEYYKAMNAEIFNKIEKNIFRANGMNSRITMTRWVDYDLKEKDRGFKEIFIELQTAYEGEEFDDDFIKYNIFNYNIFQRFSEDGDNNPTKEVFGGIINEEEFIKLMNNELIVQITIARGGSSKRIKAIETIDWLNGFNYLEECFKNLIISNMIKDNVKNRCPKDFSQKRIINSNITLIFEDFEGYSLLMQHINNHRNYLVDVCFKNDNLVQDYKLSVAKTVVDSERIKTSPNKQLISIYDKYLESDEDKRLKEGITAELCAEIGIDSVTRTDILKKARRMVMEESIFKKNDYVLTSILPLQNVLVQSANSLDRLYMKDNDINLPFIRESDLYLAKVLSITNDVLELELIYTEPNLTSGVINIDMDKAFPLPINELGKVDMSISNSTICAEVDKETNSISEEVLKTIYNICKRCVSNTLIWNANDIYQFKYHSVSNNTINSSSFIRIPC